LRSGGVGDEVWGGMGQAALTTQPFAGLTGVIVTVESQTVAMRTEWIAGGVIAAFETGKQVLVAGVVADLDRAQGVEVVVDKVQNVVKPFTGIGNHFADHQTREATLNVLAAGNGQQMVIAVGRTERAGKRPKGKETVVDDIERLGLVAKVVLAPPKLGCAVVTVCVRRAGRLIGTRIVDIRRLGVTGGDKLAVIVAC